MKYADWCLHIDTNKAHDNISEKLMNRIENLSGKLEALIERIKKQSMQKSTSSNDFKDLMEACKETSSPLLDLIVNARASVDLFCAGETGPKIVSAPPTSEEESI